MNEAPVIRVMADSRHLKETDIRLNPIGLASMNMFVPMFAYFTGSLIKKNDRKDVVYAPTIRYPINNRRERDVSFKALIPKMVKGDMNSGYVYNTRYFTHKHALYEVNENLNVNFLILLAVESRHFLQNIKYHQPLDNSKLILFVSNDINLEKHESVKRRLKRYYETTLGGIDLLYTDNINHWCFNNNLKNIRFKDIIERMRFVNEIKSKSYGKKSDNEQIEPQAEPATGYRYTGETTYGTWVSATSATFTLSDSGTTLGS